MNKKYEISITIRRYVFQWIFKLDERDDLKVIFNKITVV